MILLENRKVRQEYQILHTMLAGVVLTGPEVKSARLKHGSFAGSYVKALSQELYLINFQLSPYPYADNREYDPKRTRKLLLKRREIDHLIEETQQKGLTIVPLTLETSGRHLKLRLGVARGKKIYERRAELKRKAIERDTQQLLKHKVRIR